MSELVSAFWPVKVGEFEYLFFIVNLNDFSSTISKSLDDNLEIFGENLKLKGKVINPYKRANRDTYEEIIGKENWPNNIKSRFEREVFPSMLVIDEDFKAFDPNKHSWGIIWFSDYKDDPNSIPKIFATLLKKIEENVNLFDYFKYLSVDLKTKDFAEYFEFKPKIFGISVDVKAMLIDIKNSIRMGFDSKKSQH